MNDEIKSKKQLIGELETLRHKLQNSEREKLILSDQQIKRDQFIFDENLEVVRFLKESRSFSHLTNDIIGELIPHSKIIEYPSRTELLKEGDPNTQVFFLMRGIVSIYAEGEFILRLQRKGDIFGEMSVISSKPCSATVIAETQVKAFSIDAKVIGKFTDISSGLLHNTLYRIFSMILTEKLSLTTHKAKQYETEHKTLLDEIKNRKQIEQYLRIAKEEADIANRTKNEFMANMSHELRTPLNAIAGFSELLLPLLDDSNQKSYLSSIQSASMHLLTLITDILDLSRIESGKMEIQKTSIDIHGVFQEIEHIFRIKAMEKDIELTIEFDPEFKSMVILDKPRLRQILFNLMGNAIKFTEKGKVKLDFISIPHVTKRNRVSLNIGIEDTGIGIPEEEQQRIFESFTQQDGRSTRKYGGTGLGLAICQRLVEIMGGEIKLTSTVGVGSRFEVQIRDVEVSKPTGPDLELKFSNFSKILFEKSRILVVDDVALNRTLMKKILTKCGVEVLLADNGEEAVKITREQKPDLIIMDIMMPVMDGAAATKIIIADPETKDIPILAFTAYIEDDIQAKLIEIGFSACLYKPINTPSLYKELVKYLPYSIEGS